MCSSPLVPSCLLPVVVVVVVLVSAKYTTRVPSLASPPLTTQVQKAQSRVRCDSIANDCSCISSDTIAWEVVHVGRQRYG